ncbi:hypothetical protein [Pseudomonas sp. LFM046]|uniref:hypothetical protein n=1 Tax=Pseudomonas sp. LFM046 TaxID=1608357 RepID=UPI0005CFB5B8|nr:hypothetical protein [Pseudomonas sp. LFM046]
MARDKETALMQALVAVLTAAKDLGVGDQVVETAVAGLVGNDPRYSWVEHPHFTVTIQEIQRAVEWSERRNG